MKNISKYILFFICSLSLLQLKAQSSKNTVFLMKIRQEIDPRMSRYVHLALEQAKNQGADYVIIDMDTYGGRVDNADEIVTEILDFDKPVYVFINKDAASAGAWISIACDKIYMAEGASIGASTVVVGDGKAAPDKYQSYMRSKMRSTAASKGRDPDIAEAMVDQSIEIEGISKKGKVLTFSTDEAIKHEYCDAKAKSVEDILKLNHISNYELVEYKLSSLEKFIHIFLNPYLSGILLLVILGGIYFELQTPGVGFPILAALIASVLYFIPYYMTGLAQNWELVLFMAGILLLMAEVFVIPGFGIAGVSGFIFSTAGLMLMMVGNNWFDFGLVQASEVYNSLTTLIIGVAGSILLVLVAIPQLLRSKRFKEISLQESMNSNDGYTANMYEEDLVGKVGVANTVLRPSGKISINDNLYTAYTRGEYIEKDTKVVIISQEGTSLKVKEVVEENVS